MSTEDAMGILLRWRAARAADDAPPPPAAHRLLQLARPWWDAWPEQLEARVERLTKMQVRLGVAQHVQRPGSGPHPVPTLVVRGASEVDATARVLYFAIQRGRLRLRFQLDGLAPLRAGPPEVDVTFVAPRSPDVLCSARAVVSHDAEYSVEGELPESLAEGWQSLRVTDEMPFRLIIDVGDIAPADG